MNSTARYIQIAGAVLLIAMASLLLLGCTTVEADTATLSAERPLVAEVVCPYDAEGSAACYLVVTVGAFEHALKATITAEVAGGVQFDPAYGQFFVSGDGRSGASAPIEIPLLETRQVVIPLIADPANTISGGYIVLVRATGSGLNEQRFQTYAIAYVKTEADSAHILSSAQALDAEFGAFVPGSGDLSYLVAVDPLDPTRGNLLVKIPSRIDSYQPELVVTVRDGIAFEQTTTSLAIEGREARQKLGVISAGGYRIAAFPFTLVPGSLGGQRVITVGVRQGDLLSWLEIAPTTLVLQSDVLTGQFLIATGRIEPSKLFDQPVVVQNPDDGMRGGGISEPAATPGASGSTFVWDRVISGFHGNRWQAYQEYVAGQTTIEWETFRDLVVLFNPKLQNSGFVFQSDAQYVFPR